jgi:hypothetical protein
VIILSSCYVGLIGPADEAFLKRVILKKNKNFSFRGDLDVQ